MPPSIPIRPSDPADLPALLPMIEALARHHGDTSAATLDSLRRDQTGPEPWLSVLVAEGDAGLLGYAATLPHAQLHFGTRGLDLHHLYIQSESRGQGLGAALVAAVIEQAKARGCHYLAVGTDPANSAAQRFYRKLGFTPRPDAPHRFLRRLDAGAAGLTSTP